MASDEPVAGFYRTTLVRGGPFVAVRIWWGPPVVDGDELDRSPRWNVEVDGRTDRLDKDGGRELLDIERFWPWCGRHPIPEEEYRHMLQVARHARAHDPALPQAAPDQPVEWNSTKLRF